MNKSSLKEGVEMKKKQTTKDRIKAQPVSRYNRRTGLFTFNLAPEADWLQQRRKSLQRKGKKKGGDEQCFRL